MKYIAIAWPIAALILTAQAAFSSALGGPVSFCKNDDGAPPTIACAGLEVSENGCPADYIAEEGVCLANNLNAEHQVVVRSVCEEGYEMVGKRCVFEDEGGQAKADSMYD